MSSIIDQALDILQDTGPEYGNGFSNHAPMAAEALLVLGREDAIISWVEKYRKRLPAYPASREIIDQERFQEALGDIRRFADWTLFFEKELSTEPWGSVLNTWVPRLMQGMVGAAFHGIIRTGHAVRNLANEETEQRLRELAAGLAYWASRYQTLPGIVTGKQGGLKPTEALPLVECLPADKRVWHGLIFEKVQGLLEFDPFRDVINLVDTSIDIDSFFSDLFEAAARVYLANGRDKGSIITFIHTMTGPGAVQLMAPYLSQDTVRIALRYCWQASAGIYAAIGMAIDNNPYEAADGEAGIDELVDLAVATGDEHAFKFVEVCLRAYKLEPKPLFLVAARHAAEHLRRP
ncbi:MAG: questin oxidase family protein [Smithella sp.]